MCIKYDTFDIMGSKKDSKYFLTLKIPDDELKRNMRMIHVTWNFPDCITADNRGRRWF